MEMYLGMTQEQADTTGWRGTDEGGKLKETGTTHWANPNTGATNASGFTGLPGGFRFGSGSFNLLAGDAFFWSSSDDGISRSLGRRLSYQFATVSRYYYTQMGGFSMRCVRD